MTTVNAKYIYLHLNFCAYNLIHATSVWLQKGINTVFKIHSVYRNTNISYFIYSGYQWYNL